MIFIISVELLVNQLPEMYNARVIFLLLKK